MSANLSPKHEITILYPGSQRFGVQLAPNVVERSVPARIASFQDSLFVIPSFREWAKALEGFDLIHVCDYFYATSILPFLPKRGPVTLVTNALPGYSFLTGAFPLDQIAGFVTGIVGPRLLPRFDRIASVTQSLVGDLVFGFGVEREKVSVIPAGVDWQPSNRDKGALREKYGIKQNQRVLMTMGRLVRVKRVEIVIETARLIGAKALILGAGPQREYLESFAKSIQADCVFFGHAPESVKLDCLAMADIFLLTSLSEGLPTTALEAMANGLPVVSNDLPGMRDVITQGKTGILVKDSRYMVACLNLLNNKEISHQISTNAAKLVRETRSWQKVGQMYDAFFEGVAA